MLSESADATQPDPIPPKRRGQNINRSAVKALENLPPGSKISLTMSTDTKSFVGTSGTQFATECGIVIRNVCPLNFHKWESLPATMKEKMYEKLQVCCIYFTFYFFFCSINILHFHLYCYHIYTHTHTHSMQVRFNLLRTDRLFMEYVDTRLHSQWKRTRGELSAHWREIGGETNPEFARSQMRANCKSLEDWHHMCDYWEKDATRVSILTLVSVHLI